MSRQDRRDSVESESRNARPPVRIRMFGNEHHFLSLCHRELAFFRRGGVRSSAVRSHARLPRVWRRRERIRSRGYRCHTGAARFRRVRRPFRVSSTSRLEGGWRTRVRGSIAIVIRSRPHIEGAAAARQRSEIRNQRSEHADASASGANSPRTPRVCLPPRNRGARSRTRPRRLPHSPFPDAPARSRAFAPRGGFSAPRARPERKAPPVLLGHGTSPAPSPPCCRWCEALRGCERKRRKGQSRRYHQRHAASAVRGSRAEGVRVCGVAVSVHRDDGLHDVHVRQRRADLQHHGHPGGIFNPIKAILRSGKTFERFADEKTDVTGPRLAFCGVQCVGPRWRCGNSQLGSPTHASDWVSGMRPPTPLEHAPGDHAVS